MADLLQKRVRVHFVCSDSQSGDLPSGNIYESQLLECPHWIGVANHRYHEMLVFFRWAGNRPGKSWLCYRRPVNPALACISEPEEREDLKEYIDPGAVVQELTVAEAISWCGTHGRELPQALRRQNNPNTVKAIASVSKRSSEKPSETPVAAKSIAMTKKEIAARLNIGLATLRKDITAGRIKLHEISRQRYEVFLTDENRRFFNAPQK